MREIAVLDQQTIDKIAAGEVVERPASVVKELIENAIDAGATAITAEITEGGKKLIRITDNGSGIPADQAALAFCAHATSKLEKIEDLSVIDSFGFRGEALSSIAAVSEVEMITKTSGDITGTRYVIAGGAEQSLEEIGAPEGTTFLVKDLFFNTPARHKFLKSDTSEAMEVGSLMEQLALSHPNIAFKYITNKQVKMATSGNGNGRDVIYHIYGRDIAKSLIEVSFENEFLRITGYIGKPEIARGNRSFEHYFVNGRYVRNNIVTKAIEDGYKGFLMQHKFPFVVLSLTMNGEEVDVNVHPRKLEVRFSRGQEIYEAICDMVSNALRHREMIPSVTPGKPDPVSQPRKLQRSQVPEPFETKRLEQQARQTKADDDWHVGEENSYEKNTLAGAVHREEDPFFARLEKAPPADSLMPQEEELFAGSLKGAMRETESEKDADIEGNKDKPELLQGAGSGKTERAAGERITERGVSPEKRSEGESLSAEPDRYARETSGEGSAVEVSGEGQSAVVSGEGSSIESFGEGTSAEASGEESSAEESGEASSIKTSGEASLIKISGEASSKEVSGEASSAAASGETEEVVPAGYGKDAAVTSAPDQSFAYISSKKARQMELFEEKLLDPKSRVRHRLIGKLFDTYWLVEFGDNFYLIDQHAAHEKINYERLVAQFRRREIASQLLAPPLMVTLSTQEEAQLKENLSWFTDFGFDIEHYGGKEYCIHAVPTNIYQFTEEELFHEMLDSLSVSMRKDPMGVFAYRLASMSCKAAVKGGNRISFEEANAMIDELLQLENPYHCPHGRPTIICMTKAEIEKKFHRIV